MISRGAMVLLSVLAVALSGVPSARGTERSAGPLLYVVRPDPRLCPSPLCGGHWAALANRARTKCHDANFRPRCYVARIAGVHPRTTPAAIPAGALVRAGITASPFDGFGKLGVLVVTYVFSPAGAAPEAGGFFRLVDTGIRCVRAPCFSFRASRLNRSSRASLSGIDLEPARATRAERERAEVALGTKNGLLARGRIVSSADGGRLFRATRLFLRSGR